MNFKFLLKPALLVLLAAAVAGCATTRPQPPSEWDGLVLQPDARLRAVWVRPEAALPAFTSVQLKQPVSVSFAQSWDPNRGRRSVGSRVSSDDLAAIQQGLADLFVEVLRAELARGNYALVDTAGPDTLRIDAAIVDLSIAAPDVATTGRTRTYTANPGSMTLVMEARDSVSGELLARAVDRQSGNSTGIMTFTNRTTNTADARRAIAVWARALRAALDDLQAKSAG
jgi:hypothetical protein